MGMIITVLILKEKIRLDKMMCIKFFKKSLCGKCLINCNSQEFSTGKKRKKQTRAIYKKREGERAVEIYYKPWAHVITEAAKSHDLSSASWRPRKASGII